MSADGQLKHFLTQCYAGGNFISDEDLTDLVT